MRVAEARLVLVEELAQCVDVRCMRRAHLVVSRPTRRRQLQRLDRGAEYDVDGDAVWEEEESAGVQWDAHAERAAERLARPVEEAVPYGVQVHRAEGVGGDERGVVLERQLDETLRGRERRRWSQHGAGARDRGVRFCLGAISARRALRKEALVAPVSRRDLLGLSTGEDQE